MYSNTDVEPNTNLENEDVLVTTISDELFPTPDVAYTLQLGRIPMERHTQTDILVRIEIEDFLDQPYAGLVLPSRHRVDLVSGLAQTRTHRIFATTSNDASPGWTPHIIPRS
jgi:hypothetical protein